MSGALALALVLALPASTGGRWGVGVNSDVQGGVQAVAPGQQSRPVVSTSVTPQLSLSLLANAYTFRINYGLRVYRRFELNPVAQGTQLPNGQLAIKDLQRFLLLHTMGASATTRLAAGWSMSANANITLGEVDVPSAASYLQNSSGAGSTPTNPGTPTVVDPNDPNFAGLPTDDGVIETISISTNATARGNLSRDWSVDVLGAVAHSRPISVPAGAVAGQTFIPIQTTINTSSNLGYKLGAKDTLKLGATLGLSYSDVGGDYRNLGGTAGWTRRLGVYTNLGVNAGVQHTTVLSQATNVLARSVNIRNAFSPLAGLTFNTVLLNLRWTRWSGGVSGVISSVRNPVGGFIEPRAGLTLQTSLAFMPSWSVGVSASLTTPASKAKCVPSAGSGTSATSLASAFCRAETNLQVRVPVIYRFSKGISASAGLTYQIYAPRFSGDDFAFNYPSYTMFAQLSMATDQAF
ncbi:MAG: hypothetical protein H6730_18350 [Deltaproteobacteria bacterium]|nr:hypothetical protein [Deltaproteobacteria bacterium]